AFTPQQSAAITARGNVLVVAGAGTGKTHTLIARCLRLIAEERASLENILLVTFTEAAAAELRARLRQDLLKLHATAPTDEHLAEQLALLETARISTLHGFCLQLIRAHFHLLGLDPSFGILDEQQTRPLQRTALDELLEQHYSGTTAHNRAVQQLIRTVGRGADKHIRSLILRLHAYTQSLPDPAAWLAAQEKYFAETTPAHWQKLFIQAVADWRDEWTNKLNGDFEMDEVPAVELALTALTALPKNPSLEQASTALRAVLEADADKEKNWPRGSIGKVRDPLKKFFSDAEFLGALAPDGQTDPLAEDWQWARSTMTVLLLLVRDFTEQFAAKKRELGGVDFTDLEQLALRLLRESDLAASWRARFSHVFVDEYQDINAAQDAILTALSRNGDQANRFLVGDVKQSIYRFRLANPKIFQTYQRDWPNTLALTENFRSRQSLINFVNPLFAALMRADTGSVDYEPLVFGAAAERASLAAKFGDKPSVELHFIAKAGEPNDEEEETETPVAEKPTAPDLLAVEREARLVARRLRELHERGELIWDKELKVFRPVKWRDMTVLLRSPRGRAEAFAIEFNKAGVPLTAARDGFFASPEVSDLLNLLKLLDNPLQDVPLAAVLRSPLVGLSPDELATIRAEGGRDLFWTALSACVVRGACSVESAMPANNSRTTHHAPLVTKLKTFCSQFAAWRELIRHTSLSQTLETALTETHYESLLHADPRGGEKLGNVRKLLELARQFDPYQRQGLYRFLRFVQSQEDEDLDLEPAASPTDDAVRLISIHRSKGLEFPIVALAGLGTKFNEQGLGAHILLDEQLGLCPKITPPDSEESYSGLTHWLARRTEQRELRGEELRLLYVALTRARDRLILVGTVAQPADKVKWSPCPDAISTDAVLAARSHLDWLKLWLPRATTDADWRDDRSGGNQLLDWKILDAQATEFTETTTTTNNPIAAACETAIPAEALPQLHARLGWQYPHREATTRSGKTTVSTLRREAHADDAEQIFKPAHTRKISGGKLSAAETGTAHHKFLQLLDLASVATEMDLRNQANSFLAREMMTSEELAVLDFAALADFWQSEFGQRVRKQSPELIHRELPFTARMKTADLRELDLLPANSTLTDDEFVTVQGAVDLAVIFPGQEIWLLDFKTDDLDETQLEARAEKYRQQLLLYARALARIYQVPVRVCRLHFLKPRRSVAVEL
ncbi:MAG: hypothetical protein RL380_1023, partial [Verrucomicrobiota bacterium]